MEILFLNFLEIVRKTQQCIIRIVNEYINEHEMNRIILVIPYLPELNRNKKLNDNNNFFSV